MMMFPWPEIPDSNNVNVPLPFNPVPLEANCGVPRNTVKAAIRVETVPTALVITQQ